jgi:hypothetical protein
MSIPIILRSRLDVCEAYVRSPLLALEELASASLKLAPLVVLGELSAPEAYDPLQEVAENLGLVNRYGQDTVQAAISYGPRVCDEIERLAKSFVPDLGRAA